MPAEKTPANDATATSLPPRASDQGFRLVTRDEFLAGSVEITAFEAAPSMMQQQIEERHRTILEELRARASQYQGTHVIYDPNADSEGWLLVGAGDAIVAETEQMLTDLAA